MQIIKEFCAENSTCVVRSNCYGSSFSYIKDLVAVVKSDFPEIDDDMITIVHYAGERYKHTFGVEFVISSKYGFPRGYIGINSLEMTL